MNSSNRGASGGSTHNSGSSAEFQRDSAQLDLVFNAISTIVLTSTLTILSLTITLNNNWVIDQKIYWSIMPVLCSLILGILVATSYAVRKTNRLPLNQPESRQIYTQCFTTLNLIFKAISSIASIFTFFVAALNVINDNNWRYNGAEFWFIIIGLGISTSTIVILTVQTVRKARSTFQ